MLQLNYASEKDSLLHHHSRWGIWRESGLIAERISIPQLSACILVHSAA